jgi:hypothetical protein
VAEVYLLKLQRLQNRVLRIIANVPRRSLVRDLHMVFGFQSSLCIRFYSIIKLCRQQADVIQNHENERIRCIGQGEGRHKKYRTLKLGDGQAEDLSND